MKRVRLGFIGCGAHATENLYPKIELIPELELVATCDLKKKLAKRNAKLFGAQSYYTNFEEMLASENLDAVMIVGPPKIHTELGIACLERALHVFVEKPIAITIEDAKKFAEVMDKTGKFGQVGHFLRHTPAHKQAKQIIDSVEFGKPIFIECKYFTPGPREPRFGWGISELDWTYMLVQGIHPIDLARHLMGEIACVSAKCFVTKAGRQAFAVSVQFANGTIGILNLNASSPKWQTRLEIIGDKSSWLSVENMIELRYERSNPLGEKIGFNKPSPAQIIEIPNKNNQDKLGYLNEIKHFTNSILSSNQPYPDLWDGYKAMVVAKGILDGVKTGGNVQLHSI